MARKAMLALALTVLAAGLTAGAVGAQTSINLPGGIGVTIPGSTGGGGVNLPGGVGVTLPGGGSSGGSGGGGGANIGLPGGGGISLGGGGGGGGSSPPTSPPDASTPPPPPAGSAPAPGSETGSTGGGGTAAAADGTAGPSGGRGHGTRDDGQRRGEQGADAEQGGTAAEAPPIRRPDGVPTQANPNLTVADFGPAPLGVPNFIIDQFTIPPFLLPIYQACGTQYGIPWQVLASINRIETAFGTNLNVSTAGAVGWMQFMPSTWQTWGVDANNDGRKDPYNPVDAICAAARYLKAAGGQDDLRTAIFAYNHADWYVDEVLLYANQYGDLPDTLVSSLTGLTEGARFPVAADARYADDIAERRALRDSKHHGGAAPDAQVVPSAGHSVGIYADEGSPVIAVNDGVIRRIGHSQRLGRYMVLVDAYGNRFTYAGLGQVSQAYPVPRDHGPRAADYQLSDPHYHGAGKSPPPQDQGPVNTEGSSRRLFAFPDRAPDPAAVSQQGSLDDTLFGQLPGAEKFTAFNSGILRFNPETMELRPLKEGSKVVAGTLLGRVGSNGDAAPHLEFAIRPAGRGAPSIDPKPILDGWKLLEATALYRVVGKDPFAGGGASISQILLLSKEQLARRVLADPQLDIYACGREDISTGQIDRRILALLEYLVGRGFKLTITSLKCGHSIMTSTGNVSEHSTGNAVDIATINGVPVLGHQGPGTLADALIREVLKLQGAMKPHQIISLMDYFNADNAFAMADHDDHVHIGYAPAYAPDLSVGQQFTQVLRPDQWRRLISQLSSVKNPTVPTSPSKYALPAHDRRHGPASPAHRGE